MAHSFAKGYSNFSWPIDRTPANLGIPLAWPIKWPEELCETHHTEDDSLVFILYQLRDSLMCRNLMITRLAKIFPHIHHYVSSTCLHELYNTCF
jgi:hypothetical protein